MGPKPTKSHHSIGSLFVQWFVHLLLLGLIAGEAVPGINESHYLTKAKHAWDSEFAPGDLFLESHDSHLVSTATAGFLTSFLPLAAVAWIGRIASWSFMALAWLRLTRSLGISAWISPFAMAGWYYGIAFGNWAGEWAIGGFEGKAIAYPCVILALASMVEQRWSRVWLWLAGAIVWHPLVGGWAGLCIGLTWLFGRDTPSLRSQLPWLATGAAISMLGIVPALLGIGGNDRDGNLVASQIHVYYRLGHHLCPLAFDQARHIAGAITLSVFAFATGVWWSYHSNAVTANSGDSQKMREQVGQSRMVIVAWWSVLFALVGLAIDVLLSNPDLPTYQPVIASKLLRFYWFRWADVAVPLAAVLVVFQFTNHAKSGTAESESQSKGSRRTTVQDMIGAIAVVAVLICIGNAVFKNWNDTVPDADKSVVQTPGPHSVKTDDRYVDWLAVCDWISKNTPADSLWLTPKFQQSFKWHAQRAEVVCWKDVPQDNASVLEWYRRIDRCEPPRDRQGRIRGWTADELQRLALEYDFKWVLVDKTHYSPSTGPPLIEIAYPLGGIPNRSFAVFRIR